MKNRLKKLVQYIKANKLEAICLILLIGVASFLRFYKITDLQFFTYDQARDDLIVKRILVDHKLTLLGPQSSMKGVYLPPFYYYTLVPILWLSGLNPIGVDIYTALIGVLTVFLLWFIVREIFGKSPALAAAGLYAASPLIVELSRHAWNPNTQPFFVLLTIYFWYRLFQGGREKYLVLSSFSFGYAVNLHYGVLSLLPIWLFAAFWSLIKLKGKWPAVLSAFVLFVFGAPLILFDLRHQFMLTRNIYLYFFAGERISLLPGKFFEPMAVSIYQLFVALFSGSFIKNAQVPFEFWGKLGQVTTFAPVSIIAHKPLLVQFQWWGIGMLIVLIFSLIFFWREGGFKKEEKVKRGIILFLAVVFVGALMSRFYIGKFYFFYYIFLYSLPFLFLGFLFWFWWQKKSLRLLVILGFLGCVGFNLRNALVFEKPGRTIKEILAVSEIMAKDIGERKDFVIAANYRSPDRWDHNAVDYRYFVEAYFDKRGLDWQPEDYRKAKVLYMVAEGSLADPVNAKIMEIYEFGPKKIEKTWELPKEVVIYKLVK